MVNFADFFVYMLMFPVALNILLPLGMLGGWLCLRGVKQILGEEAPAFEHHHHKETVRQ